MECLWVPREDTFDVRPVGGAGVQIPTRRASLSIGPSLGSSGLLSGIKYRLGDVQYRADLANRYESPSSVDETLALLASYREQARLIAGGTDLVLEMRRGSRPEVEVLVDISRVDGLDRIEQDVGGGSFTWGRWLPTPMSSPRRSFGIERFPWRRRHWKWGRLPFRPALRWWGTW